MSLSESVSRLREHRPLNPETRLAIHDVLDALERSRTALQPFACLSDAYIPGAGTGAWEDEHTVWQVNDAILTLGDLRAARAALAEEVPA